MALSDDELLEKQLTEAGNQLLSPSSSVAELLSSLDRVENLLTRVEQSPSESMKIALSPSMKALIANDLLRHKDIDVNVAVASCISEITRITAPDAPYEDDQMKEVFQLIVSSFEKLDDQSSPSYAKRTSILETVAKVRSCVVMLDLECDALIAEMFHHFFRTIRSEHPENVFLSMETIMTLVLEESEDISTDLCSSILNVLKTENKEVLPVARQLGEKVADKCASKLKPYLLPAIKSLGTSVEDYSKVVAKVFQAKSETVEPSEAEAAKKNVAGEDDQVIAPSEKAVEVALENLDDAPPSEEVGPSTVGSPKAVASNGTIQKEVEDTSGGNDDPKEVINEAHDDSKEVNNEAHNEVADQSKGKLDNSDAEELTKSRTKPVKVNKRKGKKMNSLKSSSQPTVTDEKEIAETPVPQERDGKDADIAQSSVVEADSTEPAKNEKEPDAPVPSPKTSNEPVDAPSSPTGSIADENPKKDEPEKKKDEMVESEPTGDDEMEECDVEKASEGVTDTESKLLKQSGKKAPLATDKEDCVLSSDDPKDDEKTSDVDAKLAKQLGKKAEVVSPRDNKKKRGQVKATPAKELAKTPSKDDKKSLGSAKSTAKSAKSESDVEKASDSNSKRKRTSEKKTNEKKASSEKKISSEKKVSNDKKVPFEKKAAKYGKELVGLKVQVWWPDDKKYYKGVIEHFEPASGKHKVLYSDGDVEVLKLEKEKWKLINDDSVPDEGDTSDGESPDEAAETPKAKKAKTSPAPAAKQGKTDTSAKKSGASTSKSKTTTKSRTKLKDDSKVDGKEKEETLKSIAKSEEVKGGKTKDSKSGNKDKTPKAVGKSIANDVDAAKGSNKLKQETPKGAAKSKGKSPKSSGSKVKDAPPAEEDEDSEEDMVSSPEPPKVPEISKGKSVNTSKSKSAKKRKRSTKG